MKSTNYYNTFIEVAEDCPVTEAEVPQERGGKQTVATIQYDLISQHPYQHTSDDVLFQVHAIRNNIPKEQQVEEREKFFSRGQPCLRASPLTKRYGWGVHSNSEGKIALYAVESSAYKKLTADQNLRHLKAMRSKKRG